MYSVYIWKKYNYIRNTVTPSNNQEYNNKYIRLYFSIVEKSNSSSNQNNLPMVQIN